MLISLAALAACADDDAQNPPPAPPSSTMTFGGTDATLSVDVADETDERQRGLMGIRTSRWIKGWPSCGPSPSTARSG